MRTKTERGHPSTQAIRVGDAADTGAPLDLTLKENDQDLIDSLGAEPVMAEAHADPGPASVRPIARSSSKRSRMPGFTVSFKRMTPSTRQGWPGRRSMTTSAGSLGVKRRV
mgnify:CR=1 FL=1